MTDQQVDANVTTAACLLPAEVDREAGDFPAGRLVVDLQDLCRAVDL